MHQMSVARMQVCLNPSLFGMLVLASSSCLSSDLEAGSFKPILIAVSCPPKSSNGAAAQSRIEQLEVTKHATKSVARVFTLYSIPTAFRSLCVFTTPRYAACETLYETGEGGLDFFGKAVEYPT